MPRGAGAGKRSTSPGYPSSSFAMGETVMISIVERLEKHAEWALSVVEGGSVSLTNYKTLHDDLIDAGKELHRLQVNVRGDDIRSRQVRAEIEDLREKLEMARTEAKDVQEFRDRENKEAQNVIVGMKLAIHAMMGGLKGGAK